MPIDNDTMKLYSLKKETRVTTFHIILNIVLKMKKHTWLDSQYNKDTVSLFFLNFHYIFLLSILQCIFTVLILPAGAAWMAMCECFRELSEGGKISLKTYFRAIWKYKTRGLLYSLVLVCGIQGIVFSMLLSGTEGESGLSAASAVASGLMLGVTIYLPFTLRGEEKVLTALYHAFIYFFGRFFSSIVLLLIIYIFFQILNALTPVLILFIMPGLIALFLSRMIVANNTDIDMQLDEAAEDDKI